MEEGQLAIAARVVERTDDEIEDAVRQRLLSEAVKAVAVKVIPDQDPRKARRRRYCTAVVVVLGAAIIIIVISVAVTMKKQSDNKVNDGRPTIAVAFQFDQFAEETGWNLTCTSGKNSSEIALNVTVPQGAYNVSFVYVVSEPIAVDYGYECQLRVSDLFGDGFCCRHGDGYYQVVLLLGDVVLVQESGEFGSETVVNFTVTAPSPGEETNDNSTSIPNNSTSPPLWTQVGADVNGQKAGDKLGSSVSLATWNNSIIVAIGAPGEVSGDSPVGYVKVLLYNTSDTRQLGQVIFGDSFDLQTGSSVSLSVNGTVLAVGAPAAGADNEIPGSVIVYQYDEAKDWWSFKGRKISGDGSANDGFGTSAAISGDATTVVVGAPFSNSPDGKVDIGRIQVYTFNDTSSEWIQLGQDIVGTTKGDQFGFSVSISNDGRTVAAGAPSSGAERPGYSVVYKYSSLLGDWLRIGNINMGTEVGDESGTCVCLSGNGTRLAVGSPHITNGTAGYVRVLEYNSKHWEQVGRDLVDISGGAAESVSLSADGLTVAFGARTANSTGRVRVFRQENLTCVYPFCWDQVGENIVGDTSGALFGDSVSLSRDGSVIAVGSPFADEASGAVRVMMNTTN
jgi:FG-GAP repeat